MKLLIVSDSHGQSEIYQELYKMYPNMDLYLDAGDSLSDEMSIYPFISVRGNCDYYPFSNQYRVYTPFGYLLMKHKPIFTKEELENNVLLVHGHTHVIEVRKEKNNVFICPGSTSLSRDYTDGTYITIDLEKEKCDIIIYNIKSKTILTTYKIR